MTRHLLGGKWQRRILHTLDEARAPLTYRQLKIRCGMLAVGTLDMRNACTRLARRGLIVRVWPGVYRARTMEERRR